MKGTGGVSVYGQSPLFETATWKRSSILTGAHSPGFLMSVVQIIEYKVRKIDGPLYVFILLLNTIA